MLPPAPLKETLDSIVHIFLLWYGEGAEINFYSFQVNIIINIIVQINLATS